MIDSLDLTFGNIEVDELSLRYFACFSRMGKIKLSLLGPFCELSLPRSAASEIDRSAIAFRAFTLLLPLGSIAEDMGERNESVGLQ